MDLSVGKWGRVTWILDLTKKRTTVDGREDIKWSGNLLLTHFIKGQWQKKGTAIKCYQRGRTKQTKKLKGMSDKGRMFTCGFKASGTGYSKKADQEKGEAEQGTRKKKGLFKKGGCFWGREIEEFHQGSLRFVRCQNSEIKPNWNQRGTWGAWKRDSGSSNGTRGLVGKKGQPRGLKPGGTPEDGDMSRGKGWVRKEYGEKRKTTTGLGGGVGEGEWEKKKPTLDECDWKGGFREGVQPLKGKERNLEVMGTKMGNGENTQSRWIAKDRGKNGGERLKSKLNRKKKEGQLGRSQESKALGNRD